jgi:hypothetical protein
MRALVAIGALAAALTLGLSSCVYVPVEPVPAYRYVEPVPATPYPPVAYRRCARGWHWVRGHYNRWGRWVPSHCTRNWVQSFRQDRGTTAARAVLASTVAAGTILARAGPTHSATIVPVDLPADVRSVLGSDPPNSTRRQFDVAGVDIARGLDRRVLGMTGTAIRQITTPAKR